MARGSGDGLVAMVVYAHYPWDPRVRREAETLVRLGRRVTVLCAREEGNPATETTAGVYVRRLPLAIHRGGAVRYLYQYGLFLLLAWFALGTLARRERVRAVHVHSLPDFLVFCAFWARLRGLPVVLDLHEAMPEIFAARFPGHPGVGVARALEKVSCLVATRVVVVNETIREGLVARGVPADRLVVLYNSPDLEGRPTPSVWASASRDGPLRIVYVGGIDTDRDVATLVRAAVELRKVTPVELRVYGPGPADYRQRLDALVDSLRARSFVRIGGPVVQEAVLDTVAETDVGVATYERNPITEVILPSKVFEFVVLDKPLVLPDLRAMRRMFSGAASFYEPGNPADLAAKIWTAAQGGPEVEAMLRRARQVYEGIRWEVQTKRLAGLYEVGESASRAVGDTPCT